MSRAKREKRKDAGYELRGYRRHPIGLKQQAVERMKLGEDVSALARVGARVKKVSANGRCCISRLSQKRAQSTPPA